MEVDLAIVGAVPLGSHSVCVALSDGSYVLLSLEHLLALQSPQAALNILRENERGLAARPVGDC